MTLATSEPTQPGHTGPSLVRGLAMQPHPHVLRRPSHKADAAAVANAPVRSFDEGVAEGLQRGIAQGRALALAQVESARAAAIEQGHAEGLRAGHAQAEREAQKALETAHAHTQQAAQQRLARLDALLASVANAANQAIAAAHDDLVALAFEATCKVIGAAALTREGVSAQVAKLLADHRHKSSLALHLHPADAALLRETGVPGPDGERVTIVADSYMPMGGVQLRSSEGSLDARLDTQLQAWRESMLALRQERA
ncbi:hypothetical protein GHT07_15450 [Caenimonas koreensis DSM 17982]|uniref:Flagellar assembly protein FliH n=1 Tax=Caenimonas koreensis DSM 17982 TaxID=1121255 RepID=A0A844AX96_9BURK|nr:FliH/SctL family protein [Caenimonas koreensis]MRD48684.1 hypothetical protein [Caenimonas koreensis DSM 17982]